MSTGPDTPSLLEVTVLTRMIRQHEAAIRALGEQRRELVMSLQGDGTSYRELADAMSVSEAAVYKILQAGRDSQKTSGEA